jgi:predicted nucleotidyltransferase
METIVKQAREVGTSAGVLLPRSWLNKQVVVTLFSPSIEEIGKEVWEILFKDKLNEQVKGIYLYGSYARGDYDSQSDIDILVITHDSNKLIKQGNYEILFVSEDRFARDLPESLNYLSMLLERKVILNSELIEKYSLKRIKKNFKKNIIEIEKIVKINNGAIKDCEKKGVNVPDGIIYSVVLRLRELLLAKKILSGKTLHKDELIKVVGESNYSAYNRIKRNEKELENVNPKDVTELLEISEKWLRELKG